MSANGIRRRLNVATADLGEHEGAYPLMLTQDIRR